MIITRTPFRISFFGGGTDYPEWFKKNSGQVIATSINKYCYISCRYLPPFFEHKHRIVYSNIERVKNISDINHPSVKACLESFKVSKGLEIHHDGDLPARSGLGSSSSFTVGLIHALYALNGSMMDKDRLAAEAIHIEQNVIKENVGSQDQISAAYGGLNKITFNMDGSFDVSPVIIQQERLNLLNDHLMLFFTGFTRIASTIAEKQIQNINKRHSELLQMQQHVDYAIEILKDENTPIEKFGELLDHSWKLKKKMSDIVSTPEIDQIYFTAKEHGAIGGKILGAGGGGFLLLFVKPENQLKVQETLSNLINVPFEFEKAGSKVVLYEPGGL